MNKFMYILLSQTLEYTYFKETWLATTLNIGYTLTSSQDIRSDVMASPLFEFSSNVSCISEMISKDLCHLQSLLKI